MKKTQRINLRRSIMRNGVSFFAVSFIAAVSIALFMGMRSSGLAILKSASRHYQEQNVEDMEISCANGISQDDISALLARDDVTAAEGGYSAVVTTRRADEVLVLQAMSIADNINKPVIVEGTLPENPDEVAVESQYAVKKGLHIGDILTVTHDGSLLYDSYKITAIVNDPRYSYYITKDTRGETDIGTGDTAFYICLDKAAFDTEYFDNCYTSAYVKGRFSLSLYAYSDEYGDKSEQFKENLELFGKERSALRYDDIYEKARTELEVLIPDENMVLEELEKLDIRQKDWIVLDRSMVGDLLAIETVVTSINGLSYSFALMFLLVAVIVCYTAITRMISDQRGLVGAQKALGFTSGEILRHYIAYNTMSSVLGSILGCVFGIGIVEVIILYIYSSEMLIDIRTINIDILSCVIAVVICFIIFILATLAACTKLVRQPAIDLMRGEVPVKGKRFLIERLPGYKRLSLYTRTMIKNLLIDKGRAATTIAGVIGCISLLVICFSIKLSILNATEKQYSEYFLYSSRVITDSRKENTELFKAELDRSDLKYTVIQDKLKSFRTPEGSLNNLRIVTAESNDTVADYMIFRRASDGVRLTLPDDGVYISEKMAKVYDLQKGDFVEVLDSEGYPRSFRVSDIIEHYLSFHMMVTSDAYYEQAMDEKADPCVFVLKGDASDTSVKDIDGFLMISDNSEYYNNANGLDLVIFVCLALSAVMALLVLLNQYVMHINKKARELAVMRINGYTIKETKRFIYVDNIILTAFGLVLGSGFGAGLAYIVIRMLETKTDNFDFWGAVLPSCLCAILVGAFFSFAVSLIALRKIKFLNLTKASEN